METANLIVSIIAVVVDTILAGVAIIISIKAIQLTKTQIELSNKQQLFDRRLEKYNYCKKLTRCYYNAKPIFDLPYSDYKNDIDINRESILYLLLNTPQLREAQKAVDEPEDGKYREVFYEKMRELKQLSEEISIIFEKEPAKMMSDYVKHYYSYLDSLFFEHSYYVYRERNKTDKKSGEESNYYSVLKNQFDRDSFSKLRDAYKIITEKKVENQLLDQLKLK